MDLKIKRRTFLKMLGAPVVAGGIGLTQLAEEAHAQPSKIRYAKATTSVCPYCAVGCGLIVYTQYGKVVNVEGDPENPINEGTLCPKGGSLIQLANNPDRLTKPLYRSPYAKQWKEVSWDWALDRIARNIKKSRDASFTLTNQKGETVNRTEGIASVGSAALDNEECYIYQKFLRGLGLVYVEHQARI